MAKKKIQKKEQGLSRAEIERAIHLIRGQRVILDSDLASLYDVTTGRLNEQVTRNKARFPEDFAFQLTQQEFTALMSQNAISKAGRGGRRKCWRNQSSRSDESVSNKTTTRKTVDVCHQPARLCDASDNH